MLRKTASTYLKKQSLVCDTIISNPCVWHKWSKEPPQSTLQGAAQQNVGSLAWRTPSKTSPGAEMQNSSQLLLHRAGTLPFLTHGSELPQAAQTPLQMLPSKIQSQGCQVPHTCSAIRCLSRDSADLLLPAWTARPGYITPFCTLAAVTWLWPGLLGQSLFSSKKWP